MKKFLLIVLTFVMAFLVVGCGDEKVTEQEQLEKIAKGLLLNDDQFSSNTVLFSTAGTIYDVTWEISKSEFAELGKNRANEPMLIVHPTNEWSEEITLTATIHGTAEGVSAKKEFKVYVKPLSADIISCDTYAKFFEQKSSTKVAVEGTVYLLCPLGFWVREASGACIYVYLNAKPETADVQLGDEVALTGTKDIYYSMHELKEVSVSITKYGNGSFDYASAAEEITVDDFNKFNGENYNLFGKLYKVEGQIVNDTVSGKYKYAIKSALSSNTVTFYDSAMDEATLAEVGTKLNTYGEMYVIFYDYHSSNYVRVSFIKGSFVAKQAPQLSDEQKLALGKSAAEAITKEVANDIALPATADNADGLTITWASSNAAVLSADGKKGTSENAIEEVTLTATVKVGELSENVEVKVTVFFLSKSTCKAALDLAIAESKDKVMIEGKVLGLDKSGYMFVADDTACVYVRSKATDLGLAVGDSVRIVASVSVYLNNDKEYTPQLTALSATKLESAVKVLAPTKVELADLLVDLAAGSTFTADEKAAIAASKFLGSYIEITCYVSVRTVGTYTNIFVTTENSLETPAIMYNYKNSQASQDAVTALDGKQVTIIAPIYDYTCQYGWLIGEFTSITEVK